MSSHYTPYRGRRRRNKRSHSGGKFVTIFIILACAVSVRFAFPEIKDSVHNKLFQRSDYASAFSSIGSGLNGDISIKKAFKDAFAYAFSQKENDVELGQAEENRPLEITQIFNGTDAATAFAPEVDYSDLPIPEDTASEKISLPIDNFTQPLAGEIISPFGYRFDDNEQAVKFHYGVDIAAQEGTAVSAIADGTAVVVAESTLLGKYVILDHGGVQSLYANLNDITVEGGEKVFAGDSVGSCGNSAMTDTTYLHFELKYDGKNLDPENYIQWP